MGICVNQDTSGNLVVTGETTPDCPSTGGAYLLTQQDVMLGEGTLFPLTPEQVIQAWGAGFGISWIPLLMALGAAAALNYLRGR